jgi:predicted O-methyltransferase YrrM/predicted alpha/beta-fold hydrolase
VSKVWITRVRALPFALGEVARTGMALLRREPDRREAALEFARAHATAGAPASVLAALDRFARERRFLLNVGPEKGPWLEDAVREAGRDARVLEFGSFVGYSAILMARNLGDGGRLVSVDISGAASSVSRSMAELAGLANRTDFVTGKSSDVIATLEAPFDLVFLDHWKGLYQSDMKQILERGLLRPGAVVIADNVGPMFGENPYVPWMQAREDFESTYIEAHVEYRLDVVGSRIRSQRRAHVMMIIGRGAAATLGAIFALTVAVASDARADGYAITDPYLATVIGTPEALRAEVPDEIPLRVRRLAADPGRKIPDALWYGERLEYSYAQQPGRAPLIFTISGTGGDHATSKNQFLQKVFYQAGFHVVGITSPSHPDFIIAASRTSVPGHVRYDAEDIYAVMDKIVADIGDGMEVSEFYLTGYSLGAMNAAFVAKLDEERGRFKFSKVLLINPPLSLYNSISRLDRMLQNLPGGVDNFQRFFDNVMRQVSAAYQRSTTVKFSSDLIFDAFKENPPSDEQLASLIGVAFRISSAALVYTSDVMTDFGFIKPDNVRVTRNTTMGRDLAVSMRVGFTDYFHEFFWPFYEQEAGGATRAEFAREHSLWPIQGYLRSSRHIGVMHNHDDVILDPGEIDFFTETFGERAKIFPIGGHLGNLEARENAAHIAGFFK